MKKLLTESFSGLFILTGCQKEKVKVLQRVKYIKVLKENEQGRKAVLVSVVSRVSTKGHFTTTRGRNMTFNQDTGRLRTAKSYGNNTINLI